MSNEYIMSSEDVKLLNSQKDSTSFTPSSLQSSKPLDPSNYLHPQQLQSTEDVKPESLPENELNTVPDIAAQEAPKNLINTSGPSEIPEGEKAPITDSENPLDSAKDYSSVESSASLRKSISLYESANKINSIAGIEESHGKDLTSMSIDEVIAFQKSRGQAAGKAAGLYQFMPDTLKRIANKVGITGDQKFDLETQNRLAHAQLEELGLDAYQKGQMSLEKFAKRVAGVWAAFPVLEDTVIDDRHGYRELKRGDSYYKSVGNNKANVTPEEFIKMISNAATEESQPEEILNPDGTSRLDDQQKAKLNEIFAMNTAPTMQGGHHSYVTTDKKYDKEDNFIKGDIGAYRAARQSTLNKVGSTLSRIAVNTGLSAVGYLAAVADIEDYNNQDDEVGNLVTNTMEEWKASFNKDYAPIYRKSNEHLALGDVGWWLENGASLVESIGAFAITGAVTGGAASWLAGVSKLGAMGQALATLATSTALNQAEGVTSAAQVYKDIYKAQLQKGISVKQAKQIAADAAARTINVNRANILLNLTSANMFVAAKGGIAGTGRHIIQEVTKKNTKNRIVGESIQEFAEEEINLIADKAGRAFGEGRSYTNTDIVNDLSTAEAVEAGLLGAVGGAGQTALSAGIGNIESKGYKGYGAYKGKYAKQRENFKKQQEVIKQFESISETDNIPSMSDVFASKDANDKANVEIRKIVNKAEEENRDLSEDEKTSINDILKNNLYQQATLGLKTGTVGVLVDTYEKILNLSEEEAKAKGLNTKQSDEKGYYKTVAQEALDDIAAAEKQYNKSGEYGDNRIPVTLNRMTRNKTSRDVDYHISALEQLEQTMEADKEKGKPVNEADKASIGYLKANIKVENAKLAILDEEYKNLTNKENVKTKRDKTFSKKIESEIVTAEDTDSAVATLAKVEASNLPEEDKNNLRGKLNKKISELQEAEAQEKKEEVKTETKSIVNKRLEKIRAQNKKRYDEAKERYERATQSIDLKGNEESRNSAIQQIQDAKKELREASKVYEEIEAAQRNIKDLRTRLEAEKLKKLIKEKKELDKERRKLLKQRRKAVQYGRDTIDIQNRLDSVTAKIKNVIKALETIAEAKKEISKLKQEKLKKLLQKKKKDREDKIKKVQEAQKAADELINERLEKEYGTSVSIFDDISDNHVRLIDMAENGEEILQKELPQLNEAIDYLYSIYKKLNELKLPSNTKERIEYNLTLDAISEIQKELDASISHLVNYGTLYKTGQELQKIKSKEQVEDANFKYKESERTAEETEQLVKEYDDSIEEKENEVDEQLQLALDFPVVELSEDEESSSTIEESVDMGSSQLELFEDSEEEVELSPKDIQDEAEADSDEDRANAALAALSPSTESGPIKADIEEKGQEELDIKAGDNEGFSEASIGILINDTSVKVDTTVDGQGTTIIKVKSGSGEIIGAISIGNEKDGYEGISINVASKYQSKGISKHLYNLALANAKSRGLKGLYSVDNTLKTADKSKSSRKNFVTSQVSQDSKMRKEIESELINELKGEKGSPITLITDVSDSFVENGATKYAELSALEQEQSQEQSEEDVNDDVNEDLGLDPETADEIRTYEGENVSSNELMIESSNAKDTHPGSRGVEVKNHQNEQAYEEWLFTPGNKVGTRVRISINFGEGEGQTNKAYYQQGSVADDNIFIKVEFLNPDGTPITVGGVPVISSMWNTKRADGSPRENDPASQIALEEQRALILERLRQEDSVETVIQEQLPAAFKEEIGANNNIAEVFDSKIEDLEFGVVRNDGNYATIPDTNELDGDLGAFASVPKVAGRLYIKIPNNMNETVPALLNIRFVNKKEADFIIDLYKDILENLDQEFRNSEISEELWERFEELIPGDIQDMLGDVPTYANVLDFLIYNENASKNPDKLLTTDNGVLNFGLDKVSAHQIDDQRASLVDFFINTQRRRVDIEKLSDPKSSYREHIITQNILSTSIAMGPVKFERRINTDDAIYKGSIYMKPLSNPKVKNATETKEDKIKLAGQEIAAKLQAVNPPTGKEITKPVKETTNDAEDSSDPLAKFKEEGKKRARPSKKMLRFGKDEDQNPCKTIN